MRLALLGGDEEVVALARAARAAGHELAWCGDMLPAHLAELAILRPPRDDWESLLDDQFCDGVIVGLGQASPDLRLEQLQKLIGNEISVLITQLPVESVLPFHELDMLRREKRSLVRRFHPEIDHPWIAQLAEWCSAPESELGAVQQITLERGLNATDRRSVVAALARDIELLERLGGTLTSISAVSASGEHEPLRGLSVQLIGVREIPVRWSLAPNDGGQLVLVGDRKRILIEILEYPARWRMEGPSGLVDEHADFDPAREALNGFVAAIRRGRPATDYSNWSAITEAMEVVDVVELSLQKGKTIEVHHQQLTEDLAFRGAMSALGCGLLLATLFGLVVVGVAGDLFGIPLRRIWPLLLLTALGLFLLVQLVPKLFPPRDS